MVGAKVDDMTNYIWYEVLLSCGHEIRWSDFNPDPVTGANKWCESCRDFTTIQKIHKNSTPIDDWEDVPA